MRRIASWMILSVVLAAVLPLSGCGGIDKPAEKTGYALGQDIGKSLLQYKEVLDVNALKLGIEDAMLGRSPRLNGEDIQIAMQQFQQYIMSKQGGMSAVDAEKNLREGKAFLDKNSKKPGVKVTASGLQYQVLKAGSGASPLATDTVKVHYRGTLINGQEFDSSYKRNEPATFPVNGVIPGWTEALQLMKVGGKYKLYVPSNLAYGERGMGGNIAPNSTLIFEVELLGIVK